MQDNYLFLFTLTALKIIFWAVIRCSNVNCRRTMHLNPKIIQQGKIHTQKITISQFLY
jgi:hypothetical protein